MVYFVLFDEGWLFEELDGRAKAKQIPFEDDKQERQRQTATATVIADLVPWI
jgi:hypothetical protein